MYTVQYFAYFGPPLKFFACGGPGQAAAAGFQPAASAASAGQAGTLVLTAVIIPYINNNETRFFSKRLVSFLSNRLNIINYICT
jgi:hypothetical protein